MKVSVLLLALVCVAGATRAAAQSSGRFEFSSRFDFDRVRPGREEEPVACCMAMTASCLACSARMTVDEYCQRYPTTIGCESEPPVCCEALTPYCLGCLDGLTGDEWCAADPQGDQQQQYCPDPDPPVCCLALSPNCLGCAEGMTGDEWCASDPQGALQQQYCPDPEPEPCSQPCCRAHSAACYAQCECMDEKEWCALEGDLQQELCPTTRPTCATIRCASGFVCEDGPTESECVPTLTCANVLCAPGGYVCEEMSDGPQCVCPSGFTDT
eukprot:CAMPEP_0197489614 /NCGR_PEP_ID=MMETSP1311-20131121/4353_1 /TAXON_ID=464262 /ORGANISM="Genus nov. species nov., Strain RCC856" /LENGTH=269 /DNA_ID=CAMNT_0043033943 /DNA_START=75 /DNA_END=880 /DNA_ORIENTATION=+